MSHLKPDAGYLDWKHWDEEEFGRYRRWEARYFSWHLHRALEAPPREVLEVGFGNGRFLLYARDQGCRVVGLEIQEELRRRAAREGIEAHAGLETLAPGMRFDLIACFDVLEHIPSADLPPLLQALSTRLAPGGALLIRVPNGESPFGRVYQHADLTHVNTLGLSKLQQLGPAAGLAVAHQGEAPWHARGGRSLTNLARAAVRSGIEAALRFAFEWPWLSLSPNLVVVMKRAAERSQRDIT